MESRFDAARQVSLGPDLDSLKRLSPPSPGQGRRLHLSDLRRIAGNLKALTAYAHEKGLYVLVDEAMGPSGFHRDLPAEALACGADCVAQSTHKMAGSLTQTSMLHCRKGFPLTDRVAAPWPSSSRRVSLLVPGLPGQRPPAAGPGRAGTHRPGSGPGPVGAGRYQRHSRLDRLWPGYHRRTGRQRLR